MRAILLHLDDALARQESLRRRALPRGRSIDYRDLGPALRLWASRTNFERLAARLRAALPAREGPALVYCGSGDFHHIAALLIERACADRPPRSVTVVHFDNHPDWVRHRGGVHCGSWVARAIRLPQVAKFITIGVCSGDVIGKAAHAADPALVADDRFELYAYGSDAAPFRLQVGRRAWPTIDAIGEAGFGPFLAARIETDAVYVSIDKDVLRGADAVTNWDQGRMSEATLHALLRQALEGRRLVGADVFGDWSPQTYGGLLHRWLKQVESWLDQPRLRAAPLRADQVNEAANVRLFDLFAEVRS